MWSHYQFSFCKSRESYQHVKDGESWALGGNREPQTNWCPWLTFVWPSIHAKSISLFQVWGRAQFEGNGAAPSRTFVAGSRWAAVRVISHSDCDPGSSSRGCTGVQPGTKPDRDCWWETGQEKGERRGNLPLCLCSLEMERVSQKKKKNLNFFLFRPERFPRYCQETQVASWAWRRTVTGLIAVQWLNPHGFAIFVLSCAPCNLPVTSVGELDHERRIIWCL